MRCFSKAVASLASLILFSSVCQAKHENWVEVRSPNFIVVSNAGEKQARKAALQFEEIRAVFRQTITVAANHPSPVVTVLAVKDEGSMRELLPEYWTKGHSHPAGIFVSRLNQFFAAVQLDAPGTNPYETFYHEYYHTISLPYFPDMPVWLAEGLAEFFQHTTIGEKYAEMGQIDPVLLQELRTTTLIPLNLLLKVDRASPYYNEANKTSMFYAESWALTHYLMLGDKMAHKSMLISYLEALDRGKSEDEAANTAFGDLKRLQSDLDGYIRQGSFMVLHGPRPNIAEELKFRSLSEAEADAYRGGFSAVCGRTQEATATLQEALRLDPNVALAHQYLGMTEFLEGQREKALESVTKAIELDPRNSFTRYMRAFLATSGVRMMSGNSQIEEDLRQAIAISPEFVPPYSLLAVYLATVNRNLPEALSLAQKAVSAEPGNSNYQLALAQVLLRMNKFDEASAAALRASAWAREPSEKANAASFTSYLQQVREFQSRTPVGVSGDAKTLEVSTQNEQLNTSKPLAPAGSGVSVAPATAVQMQASINILSDAWGFDFTPYLKQAMEGLRKNLAANAAKAIVAKPRTLSVEFAVLTDGKISGLRISSSSGDAALDEATRDSVTASSPLPALPREFKGQYVRLHLGLSYSPENAQ
jgi:TonB family protein